MSKVENRSFTPVVEALKTYTARTGEAPLMLGGWEAEDVAIRPPASLTAELSAIAPRLHGYAYLHDLHTAKHAAAHLFAYGLRLQGEPISADNVAVFQNSTQALLLALAAMKQQGVQQIVIAAPSYFSVVEVCRHLGFTISIVPAADFVTGALDTEAIVAAMSRQHSALIITNPAYSVGVEYGWQSLAHLFAALPQDAYVILDETRLGLHWQQEAPWYEADYPARTVVIRSPSKIFFVNGLKLSLLIGPPDVVCNIELLSESLLGSVPGATEQIALAYLNCLQQWVDEIHTEHIGALRKWRREIITCLRRNSAAVSYLLEEQGFRFSPVDSGPYLLACVERSKYHGYALSSALDSYAIARDAGVLLMGSSYFFHEHHDWFGFRVNLCGQRQHTAEAVARVFQFLQ